MVRRRLSRKLAVLMTIVLSLTSVLVVHFGTIGGNAATQATYYVDPVNGNNNNSGTLTGSAFQTIAKARDTVRGIR